MRTKDPTENLEEMEYDDWLFKSIKTYWTIFYTQTKLTYLNVSITSIRNGRIDPSKYC